MSWQALTARSCNDYMRSGDLLLGEMSPTRLPGVERRTGASNTTKAPNCRGVHHQFSYCAEAHFFLVPILVRIVVAPSSSIQGNYLTRETARTKTAQLPAELGILDGGEFTPVSV